MRQPAPPQSGWRRHCFLCLRHSSASHGAAWVGRGRDAGYPASSPNFAAGRESVARSCGSMSAAFNPASPKAGDGTKPQGGARTKPRLKAWVNGTPTDTRALKGRKNRFQYHANRRGEFSLCDACAAARAYFAPSGLGGNVGGNLNPGLQPRLRYFALLGLKQVAQTSRWRRESVARSWFSMSAAFNPASPKAGAKSQETGEPMGSPSVS